MICAQGFLSRNGCRYGYIKKKMRKKLGTVVKVTMLTIMMIHCKMLTKGGV